MEVIIVGRENAELAQITEFLKNSSKNTIETPKKRIPRIERPSGFEYENGIKDRSRVVELAEVFTPEWVIEKMLNELPPELFDEPKSRFLEPSCGNGNFLIEILARKLEYIASEIPKTRRDFAVFVSLASTYGIDINQQNIQEARKRIWNLVEMFLNLHLKESASDLEFHQVLKHVIEGNIIVGDTLKGGEQIQIIEYTYPSETLVTRRLFTFLELQELNGSMLMFPRPTRFLPTVDFKEITNVD
jgi:hypothetical protein